MFPMLPLGGLKREEIYTFLAGLYVCSSWILFFAKDKASYASGNIYITVAFIFSWLLTVIIIYIFGSVITLVFSSFTRKAASKKNIDELKNILKLGKHSVIYFFSDYGENLLFISHISILVFISICLSAFPLLQLYKQLIFLYVPIVFFIVLLLAQLYLLLKVYTAWRNIWAYAYLYELQVVLIINRNEFGVEQAKYVANLKIEQAKNKIATDVIASQKK